MREVEPGQAQRLVARGAVLLDVLPSDIFEHAHLPGAANAPIDGLGFDDRVQELVPDRETPIIVYCHDDECLEGARAVSELGALGYKEVYILAGGSKAWWRSGRGFDGQQVEAEMGDPGMNASPTSRGGTS